MPASTDALDTDEISRRLDLPKKERKSLRRRLDTIAALVAASAGHKTTQQQLIDALIAAGYDAQGDGCGCAYGRFCGDEEYVRVRTREANLVFDPADGALVDASLLRR